MAQRIKNLQLQIPGGYRFLQPQTGWKSSRMASFESIVNALIAHRKGNKFLAEKHGWATDHDTVAREVEDFNVRICQQMGWTQYLSGDTGGAGPLPKPIAPSQSSPSELNAAAGKVRKIVAGVRTIDDWIKSKAPAVPEALSSARAATCAACPRNTVGDFTRWFTVPASEAIKRQISELSDRKLSTPMDDKLNICDVCLCPLKLSVHVPLELKLAHMSDETLRELPSHCWVITEKK